MLCKLLDSLGIYVAFVRVTDTQVCDLSGFFSLPAPHRERRSAITLDVTGRITDLYRSAEIFQLHRVRRSIVDFCCIHSVYGRVENVLQVVGVAINREIFWSEDVVLDLPAGPCYRIGLLTID